MVTDYPHLAGMLPADLVEHLAAQGIEASRAQARRLLAHVISHGRQDLQLRSGVGKVVRRAIEETTVRAPLAVVERVEDDDGFVKYLLRAPDGALFEAVRIPLHKPGKFSVCLSSQVGCAMGCAFCATGREGLTRNLEAWEMVAAFMAVRADTEGHLSGAVFQGQGEPFQNYDAVIQACRVLSHPCGGRIRQEAISISTVGLVRQIRRFSQEGHRYRLILSLTSAIPERRRELLPVAASKVSLEELAEALREYARLRRTRVTVAWVLLGGVNTGEDEAAALVALLADLPLRFNLIDVNDPRSDGFDRATDAERETFIDALQPLGAPVVRRYSGGSGCHAACGMLSNKRS